MRAKEIGLQRLFSTFPGGWPGVGLLLLRSAVGVTAIVAGAAPLMEPVTQTASLGGTAISVLAIGSGVMLLGGFLTPVVAVLIAMGTAGVTLPGSPALTSGILDAKPAIGFVIVMATAVVLLGPGAFSVDSILFGRREIVIPQFKRAASDRQASSE